MNLKRLSLTDIVIDINRVPKKKNLIEATDKAVSKPLARNLKVCGNKGVFSSHGDLAEDLSHISDVEVLVLKQRIYGQRKTVREIVGEEQMSLRMVAQQEAFTLVDIFDKILHSTFIYVLDLVTTGFSAFSLHELFSLSVSRTIRSNPEVK
ncbi:unnamed protein product [Arabidopsis arenosa]|uniref:Uncharacterized protein n=1 Tax=Arabidopsis arenosa TaxID=38785 RepID=A0A8S2ANI9_ARAAE|nr:unnamed protein product [Arabidopsis arenosa]